MLTAKGVVRATVVRLSPKAVTKAKKAMLDGVNAQVSKMNAMIATAN